MQTMILEMNCNDIYEKTGGSILYGSLQHHSVMKFGKLNKTIEIKYRNKGLGGDKKFRHALNEHTIPLTYRHVDFLYVVVNTNYYLLSSHTR